MASNAFSGVGTTFSKTVGSVTTVIAEIKSISGPEMSKEMIDVTSLSSENGYREFIPSFKDGGNVSLSMNFTRTGYDAIKADFDAVGADALIQYTITLPDTAGTQIIFNGYVQDLPTNITFDDAVTLDVTIKVTGEITVQDTP